MLFLLYLITVNVISLLLMHSDKHRAIKNRWRIPEAALLGVAALGGSIGILIGMYLYRHKTKHFRFQAGIPLLLILQLVICFLLWSLQR